jgi:hypothetical protein
MADECSNCGATFGNAAELVQHTTQAHPPGAPEELAGELPRRRSVHCAMCSARLPSPEALARHNMETHMPGGLHGPRRGAPNEPA